MTTALVGKYFIGVHDDILRAGIVEAAIDATHYLVRFTDESKSPPAMAMVPLKYMSMSGLDIEPPPWSFFDTPEQRAEYVAWLNENPRVRRGDQ